MRFVAMIVLLCTLVCSTLAVAAAPPLPGKDDRCPVCGMFVAPFPQWVAVIEMNDGRRFYFDGPKDMFICLFDLANYIPGADARQITGVYVTEYYSTRLLPAKDVLFVTGSNVLGPMGQELVPVLGEDAAATFKRDHAGQKLMRYDGQQLIELTAPQ